MSFDIFLSFKNTDEHGKFTVESRLARECHDYLTQRGFKVFCSAVTLEDLGVAAYTRAIDDALDEAKVLVAIGCSREHLESNWVRYEWDSFFGDMRTGIKPDGRIFVLVDGVRPNDLPRALRQNQVVQYGPGQLETLYRFIANSVRSVDPVPAVALETKGQAGSPNQGVEATLQQSLDMLTRGDKRAAVSLLAERVKHFRTVKNPAEEVGALLALSQVLSMLPGEGEAAMDMAKRAQRASQFAGLKELERTSKEAIQSLENAAVNAHRATRATWVAGILEEEALRRSQLAATGAAGGDPPVPSPADLAPLEGAWEWVAENSQSAVDGYARVIDGQLWLPYSYGEPRSLSSMFYGFRAVPGGWMSCFKWCDRDVNGVAFWKIVGPDLIAGEWWPASQVESMWVGAPPEVKGVNFRPVRRRDKSFPRWAEGVFSEIKRQTAKP